MPPAELLTPASLTSMCGAVVSFSILLYLVTIAWPKQQKEASAERDKDRAESRKERADSESRCDARIDRLVLAHAREGTEWRQAIQHNADADREVRHQHGTQLQASTHATNVNIEQTRTILGMLRAQGGTPK